MTSQFDAAGAGPGALALVGFPADDHSSFLRGAAEAPAAIRVALACASSNLCAEDGLDLGACPSFLDLGDLPLGGSLDPPAMQDALSRLYAKGASSLCLGGDHSVSYPILRALSASRGGPVEVLHIDAHPDLYDSFEGDRLSHACPFARCLEDGLISRLVQVGIRGMNAEQRATALRHQVEVIDMRLWTEGRRPNFAGDFYLSLDLDALDPAFAPGVSHREPGGLSTREVITLVQSAPGRLIGADLVEFNPRQDVGAVNPGLRGVRRPGLTAMVAAKLLKEIAARIIRDARGAM